MKTYLFFGSFNPFHNGHFALAKYILDHTHDNLWLIVSPQNPHKDSAILAPFEDRLAMVQSVAIILGKRILISDIESTLPLPSYTVNTIQALKLQYPQQNFTILAGSDIASTIHTWYHYDILKNLVKVAIYPRTEEDRALCSPEFRNAPVLQMSSTDFRNNKDLSKVPETVASYIRSHHLYGF